MYKYYDIILCFQFFYKIQDFFYLHYCSAVDKWSYFYFKSLLYTNYIELAAKIATLFVLDIVFYDYITNNLQ